MTTPTFDKPIKVNSAEYQRIHRWVIKQLGKASYCENDATHQSPCYDWSNTSQKYLLDITDWRQLCRSCHKKYDGMSEAGKKSISKKNRINSLGNTSHNTPVIGVDEYKKVSYFYQSVKAAAQSIGRSHSTVSGCLSGKQLTAGGLRWHYRRAV